jgi:hypothetical protein
MMQERILRSDAGDMVESKKLENGLMLELYDCSRNVTSDRWLVSFKARIDVRVLAEYFAGEEDPETLLSHIKATVGENVTYRYEKQRNFIAGQEKEAVFDGLKTRFLSTSLRYLSSPEFPRKLILSKHFEASGKRRAWKKH